MKPVRQLNQELFEYALNTNSQFKPQIAQIADEQSFVDTLQQQKFTQEGTGIILRRYKIRICSMHDDNTPISDLPWAYGQSPTSGLRAESTGAPIYPANTYVTVFQDPDTGIYYIDDVHPNSVGVLPTTKAPGCSAASGFVPGSALFYVPQTHYKEGRLVEGSEWFVTPRPSEEDEKQNNLNKTIVLPSKCRKVNTEGINEELVKAVKEIEKLKANLTGKDSFLQKSQDFITKSQQIISNASSKIAEWVSWLIQEIRKYVIRKVNALINDLSGNAPLSSRYLVNEVKNNTLSAISCLFVKLLQNLESVISEALNALVDKVVNTASCLIENLLIGLIGQIISQLTSAINGILGTISSLLGSIISFTTEILDFVISILNYLKCDVQNVCPVTESWNILEGGKPKQTAIDFNKIFNSVNSISANINTIINIPNNIEEFDFNFNLTSDNILYACGVDPELCSPPSVIFWGGSGTQQAQGNAVINAVGDILGVDVTIPGNYTNAPVITFEDNCGNGVGAYAVPVLDTITVNNETIPEIETIPTTNTGTASTTTSVTPNTGIAKTVFGIKNVIMIKNGYNYLPSKDGSKGGMGRVWANRCQTIVRRSNGNWDPPYSYGEPIKLFYGDMIQLPNSPEVHIDCDFTEEKLPGCIVYGTKTCLKSMIGFDDGAASTFQIPQLKSMVGFDDLRGSSPENTPPIPAEHQQRIDALLTTPQAKEAFKEEETLIQQGIISGVWRPDQFGFTNDYPYAKELGFTDQDIRFYLEGFYSKLLGKRIGPLMQVVLDDPNFGPLPKYITGKGTPGVFDYQNDYPYAISLGFNDQDIRYYLENFYGGIIADDMKAKLNDPNWGRIPEYYVTITAPDCPPQQNLDQNSSQYPVIPVIDDVYIEDGGFGFSPDDTATVLDCSGQPDPAASIDLIIQDGTIVGTRVINPGTGFTCIPEIRLNTKTGYNARLKPVLKFERPSESLIAENRNIIHVVDCVGKV